MKRYISGLAAIVMATAPALAASAPDAAEKVAQKMLQLTQAIDGGKAQIDSVMNALTSLTSEGGDLKTKFENFSKEVANTESMGKKVKSQSEKARSQRDQYLAKWQKSQGKIQNEELKKTAEARRAELTPIIDKLKDSAAGASQAFTPFLQDLKDINVFLGNDLSQAALTTVKTNMLPKCTESSTTVKSKLDDASAALKELAGRIKPGQA